MEVEVYYDLTALPFELRLGFVAGLLHSSALVQRLPRALAHTWLYLNVRDWIRASAYGSDVNIQVNSVERA